LVAAGLSFFIFTPKNKKKVPTTNRVSEWSSVPNILEPDFKSATLVLRSRFLCGLGAKWGLHPMMSWGVMNETMV
uniref:hypothetical protein n=1 Tax=Weissella confusa TaxID=1583 RepID=UPI001A7E7B68